MTNPISRKLAMLTCSLAAGATVAVMPVQSAQATNHGYLVVGSTLGECTGKLGAIKAQFMREGRNITSIINCRFQHSNSYQGHIYWKTKSVN